MILSEIGHAHVTVHVWMLHAPSIFQFWSHTLFLLIAINQSLIHNSDTGVDLDACLALNLQISETVLEEVGFSKLLILQSFAMIV